MQSNLGIDSGFLAGGPIAPAPLCYAASVAALAAVAAAAAAAR